MDADVDRQTYHEFAFPGISNTDLVKARLLFDGGYYGRSKSLLLDKSYYLKVLETSEKSYGSRFRYSAREGIRRLEEKANHQD